MTWRVVGKNRVLGVETGGTIEDIPPVQAAMLLAGGHIARVEDDPASEQEATSSDAENPQEGD